MRVAAAFLFLMAGSIPAAAADWSGAYAGLNFGGSDGAAQAANPFRGYSFTQETNAKGAVLGLQAGYNFQEDDLVYGVEAMADLAGLTGTATCLSGIHLGRCKPETHGIGSLTGRLGLVQGDNLFFVRAGLALAAETQNYLLFNDPPATSQDSMMRLGWTLGAGLEHRLAPAWSLRLDYQYLDFPGATFGFAKPQPIAFSRRAHVFTTGVNYFFDSERQADASAAAFTTPEAEPGDWAFDLSARLFGATGNMKKDFASDPGNENSRLTYQGMPVVAGDLFARADHRSGWFVKGTAGMGTISGGTLYDEDTPHANFGNGAYSNTISHVRKGSLAYQSLDAGFNLLDRDDLRLGLFAGYSHLRIKGRAFGCEQLATNDYLCRPAGYFPASFNIITERQDWHAAELGVNGRVALANRLSFTADMAYMPYVFLQGRDDHLARGIVFADHGTGDGLRLEGSLDYAISGDVSLGVGARYWQWHSGGAVVSCRGACNDNFPLQSYADPPWAAPHDTHLFGGFVQASYHIGRLARDDAAPESRSDLDWSGTYFGLQTGVRASDAAWRTTCLETPCSQGEGLRNANTVPMPGVAAYLGLLAGRLWTVAPDWLLGVEGDAGWANNRRSEANIWRAFLPNRRALPDDGVTVAQDWDLSLRLRAGTLVTPNTFLYGTAGLALAGVRASVLCQAPPSYWCTAGRSEGVTATQAGFTLGAGAETALDENLSARLEYRYSDTGALEHRFFAAAPADAITMSARTGDQRMLLGLIYRPR